MQSAAAHNHTSAKGFMQPAATPIRSKPSPHHVGQGSAKLVVRSLGTSGIGLVRSLRQVMMLGEADIAALLLQAPSTLMTGMERTTADSVAALLTQTGLDCEVHDDATLFSEGSGDFEVALHLHDFSAVPAVVIELMQLLGVDVATARKLVCTVPAPLLGCVSQATVDALRRRFAPYGAHIDASTNGADARFDVYLGAVPRALHERIGTRLVALAGEGARSLLTGGVLCGLPREIAQALADELRLLSVPLRVINRDFSRYTLKLVRANDSEALRAALFQICSMPSTIVPHVLQALPVVLEADLSPAALDMAVQALTPLGAELAVEPLLTQTFALNTDAVRDPGAAVALLVQLGNVEEAEAVRLLRSRSPRIPGPFSAPHARWLQAELKKLGIGAKLEAL